MGVVLEPFVTGFSEGRLSCLSTEIQKFKQVLIRRYALTFLAVFLPLKHSGLVKL